MPRHTPSSHAARFPTTLTVLMVGLVLYFARAVLIPIALAVLLTFLLAPLVRRLERLRFPRVAAVGVVVGTTVLGIGTIGWLVQAQVVEFAANLPQYKGNISRKLDAIRPASGSLLARAEDTISELQEEITKPSKDEEEPEPPLTKDDEPVAVSVVDAPTPPMTYARMMLGPFLSRAATTGMVVVFAIFMLIKREDLRNRFLWLVGERSMHVTTPALDEAANRVSRYLMMQLIANTISGVAIGIGLLVMGVPGALLWGLLAIIMRFIPYIGAWLAALLPIATAVAISPDWTQPLLVLGLVVAVELVMNNIVEPLLYGSGTGLSPIAILVAAVFWAWLWGPVGLVLATPLTVCLAVIGRHVPSLAFLHALLGDQPVLSPAAALYQRLLAGDRDEAGRLFDTFAKDKSLVEVYDELVLPAMRLAEADRHRGDLSPELAASAREIVAGIVGDAGAYKPIALPSASNFESPAAPVLCLPARDQSDEIAARMLAHLLTAEGVEAHAVSAESLSGEILEQVGQVQPPIVCVSAVPPAAATHSRVLCKRLRARFPDLVIMVGVWDSGADPHVVRRRLGGSGRETVVTTLAQGVDQIRSLMTTFGRRPAPPSITTEIKTEAVPEGAA